MKHTAAQQLECHALGYMKYSVRHPSWTNQLLEEEQTGKGNRELGRAANHQHTPYNKEAHNNGRPQHLLLLLSQICTKTTHIGPDVFNLNIFHQQKRFEPKHGHILTKFITRPQAFGDSVARIIFGRATVIRILQNTTDIPEFPITELLWDVTSP